MTTLKKRIAERIRADGPMTFAAFMDSALYDPGEGFYARPPVGSDKDFVTSPHVSSAFGDLVAEQLKGCWIRMSRPDRFDVVEVGAGDGTLGARLHEAFTYVGVDRSAGARAAMQRKGLETSESIPEQVLGVILANELLDNLAFHRLRRRGDEVIEVFVGLDGDDLVEIEGTPTSEALDAVTSPFEEGEERPVSPAAIAFLGEVAQKLERGYVLIYDYGFAGSEKPQPTRAYQRHRRHERVLAAPGSADITAGVDFGAIATEAGRLGATVWKPKTQREVLKALGFDRWMDTLRERRLAAEREGNGREAIHLLAERSKAPLLVDEAHLGSLKVLAFGTGVRKPPPGFDT